ncbi:MAG: tetratricopeptide repeat protein [Bacteroidetes bacterium]|nr:tetratricopeptide repeat protein [Bacteroidota bacterium]
MESVAIKFYREKEFTKAAELFQQLYKGKPTNNYYNYYFNCLTTIQDYKKADQLVKQHRKIYPDNYRFLIDEAYIAGLSGNKKKSNRILKKLIENLPAQRNQILQITSSLQGKGYPELAIKVFEKASMMTHGNNSYSFEIADAYLYSGEYSEMFDSYLSHLEKFPTDLQRVKSKLQYVMRMDVNSNLSEMLKSKLLQSSQKNPENIQLAEMLMWYSLQTKDFDMAFRQARANDLRFGNSEEDMLELANIAFSNYDYNTSAKAYKYVVDKKGDTPYYIDSYVGFFLASNKQIEENPLTTLNDYEELEKMGIEAINILGINNFTSDIVLQLAHITAFRLAKNKEAIDMIELALANPNIDKIKEANLKLKLADILLADNQIWDATLLYSQVESDMKNEPIGHEAKLKNAKVFYYVGEFDWAATRLDILKSATSKLISNDAIELSMFINDMREEDTIGFVLRKFAGAELYTLQGKYDSAMRLLTKVEEDPAGIYSFEYALYNKAQIYFELKEMAKADSVYNKLITIYPTSVKADNALYKRAELLRIYLNNIEEAKRLYLILMTDYPESIYSGKARKQYRLLEDKSINKIEFFYN